MKGPTGFSYRGSINNRTVKGASDVKFSKTTRHDETFFSDLTTNLKSAST